MLFGLYRHKKGSLYLALCKVRHSESGADHVLYLGRSGFWVRPMEMFLDGRFKRMSFIDWFGDGSAVEAPRPQKVIEQRLKARGDIPPLGDGQPDQARPQQVKLAISQLKRAPGWKPPENDRMCFFGIGSRCSLCGQPLEDHFRAPYYYCERERLR